MKKIIMLFLTIVLLGYSKDEIEIIEPDYSLFLNNRTPSLIGNLNSKSILWKFRMNEFKMSNAYSYGDGICIETNPIRVLMFGLSTDDALTQMTFITPKINTSNHNEVRNIFNRGEKQFGNAYTEFQIKIVQNKSLYVNKANAIQKFILLKTEEFMNFNNKKRMMIWVKIDHLVLENTNKSGDVIELQDS